MSSKVVSRVAPDQGWSVSSHRRLGKRAACRPANDADPSPPTDRDKSTRVCTFSTHDTFSHLERRAQIVELHAERASLTQIGMSDAFDIARRLPEKAVGMVRVMEKEMRTTMIPLCFTLALMLTASACWDAEGDPQESCTPGDRFEAADGCENCECPESGLRSEAICEAISCPQPEACTPGESFDAGDGCNQCVCPESGLKSEAVCTADGCWSTCKPGETWPVEDGCNTCACPDSGLVDEAICSQKPCETGTSCASNEDCGEGAYCARATSDCGVWQDSDLPTGTCTTKPEICVAGGPGICACDGTWFTNSCEAAAAGLNVNAYGGCGEGPATFACGDKTCHEGQLCSIALNDIVGEGEPAFFATCETMPEACYANGATPSCDCLELDPFQGCTDAGGRLMLYSPGG